MELKVRKKRDTVGGAEKKVPILQGLSLTGNYDFMRPTKKLSNLNFGGRSQFTDKFGINFNGTLSPYLVGERTVNSGTDANPINTIVYEESDRYTFSAGKLPRLTNFSFSTDFSLNPDALKSRNKNMDALKQQQNAQGRTPEQIAELEAISRDPNAFVDFNIPVEITSFTALIEGLYNGTEMVSDTITVELRNTTFPYSLIDQTKIFLNNTHLFT